MTYFPSSKYEQNATRNSQLSLKISFAAHGFPTRTASKKIHTLQNKKKLDERAIFAHFIELFQLFNLLLFLHRSVSQSSHEEVVELLYGRNQATFVW